MSLTDVAANDVNDSRRLEERLAETVGLLNVVTAELVALVGEALRTGAWEGFGIRSPEHWVVWRCGVSPARARRLVAAARRFDGLPHVGALFEAGSLSEDQTAVIVRHTDADRDVRVAELAPSLTVPQLSARSSSNAIQLVSDRHRRVGRLVRVDTNDHRHGSPPRGRV